MRRLALSALMLSPVMLHAQANLSTSNQAMLHAATIAGAASTSSDAANTTAAPSKIQMVITTDLEATQELADRDAGMIGQFSFSAEPATFDAPKLVHWTPIQCAESELSAPGSPADKLVISMVINQAGEPVDIKVVHPVSSVLDQKAVAALSQYRFTPALLAHRPTMSPVTVAIDFPAR